MTFIKITIKNNNKVYFINTLNDFLIRRLFQVIIILSL